jgi:lysophospholipase L1-like esterase
MINRRIAFTGDSNTSHSVSNGPMKFGWNSHGWASWLLAYSNRRLISELSDNFAVAGSTSSATRGRASVVAAGGYGWIALLGGGGNDRLRGIDPDVTIENLIAATETYLSAGCRVLLGPLTPRGQAGWINGGDLSHDDQRAVFSYINHRLRIYARFRLGVIWFDPLDRLVDPATGDLFAQYTYDGTHLSPAGSSVVGRCAWHHLSDMVPRDEGALRDLSARRSINTFGNALQNGALLGATGDVSSHHSGVVPDGWKSGVAAEGISEAGLIMWGKENPRADGLPGESLTLDMRGVQGHGTQTQHFVSQVIPAPSGRYAEGEVLEMTCEIEVLPGSAGILSCGIRLIENDGATLHDYRDLGNYGSLPWTAEHHILTVKSPKFTVRPFADLERAGIDARVSVTADLTVSGGACVSARIGRVSLNKVC